MREYPEWLSEGKVSWQTLEPEFRQYFLCRVGYDTNEDCEPLPDTPESEEKVLEWTYGKSLDKHLWLAKGFHQGRATLKDNMEMWNDAKWWLLVLYFAQQIYKMGIKENWWDDITKEEFESQYEWVEYL